MLRITSITFLIIILITTLEGCATLSFYSQAIAGHTSLLWHRKDIKSIVTDPATDEVTRSKLLLVLSVLNYAQDNLNLPVGDSFSTYVATGKPFILWNVFAAPELSLEMKTFCYPIAGCVSYRGYFKERQAINMASSLQDDGYDVFVGGVAAYSTLGWFSDPVLDTFLNRSDVGIARLLFHELAHKVVYIPGDTQFNESFATAVEQAAIKPWLSDRKEDKVYEDYVAQGKRRSQVLNIINDTREALEVLYKSGLSTANQRQEKQVLIHSLQAQYQTLRKSWNGENDFQYWMSSEMPFSGINNAKLGTIADYNEWVPAFHALLSDHGGDLSEFLKVVVNISKLDREARDELLREKSS
jgi:predicted aminopeptidase